MKIYKEKIKFKSTTQIEFIDITDMVQEVVEKSEIRDGEVCVFVQHTTMGIIINHNESMLIHDFMRVLYHFAPVEERYSHDLFELKKNNKTDGRSNGHSHCKAMLIGTSANIPVENGVMMLSDIQSIFAVEFDGSRDRDAVISIIGQ